MKKTSLFIVLALTVCTGCAKQTNYIASTPADAVIKSFLGIPLADSVDFIRWKLTLDDKRYKLYCNYGIAKQGTPGFINNGKELHLEGVYEKQANLYIFMNGTKRLSLLELNGSLLHFLNAKDQLLVGNGGWSYTLSAVGPDNPRGLNFDATTLEFKDSATFIGRTPCKIPGLPAKKNCNKLKWKIILYAGGSTKSSGTFNIYGTTWRNNGVKTGDWQIVALTSAQKAYRLSDKDGKPLLYLLNLDGQVLVFTDPGGNLLIGDENFSYTLNRFQ